ncbi:hypothetical protein K9N68_33180 [Kovacikia minuta CCNUW1]|uniref:hypothetical protein n=1 Tax=Kovacikia minuta TaxID=2931930 RepID=UPI001CCE5596|nr:hypothetical protein [Kovacikia minuta]UBF26300.1 hypothetical protein K9N68_33180 [Kovacikia minuta CCNUW1]
MRTCSLIHLALFSSMFGAIALNGIPGVNALPKPIVPGKSTSAVDLKFQPQSAPSGSVRREPAALPTTQTAQSNPTETTSPPAETTPPPPVPASAPLAPSEVRILTPQTQTTGAQATNLVVQYAAGAKVQVTVNQQPLNPATTTQVQPDPANNVVNQVWYNIPLKPGANVLTVQAEGGSPTSVTVTVHDTAAKILFLPTTNPQIPADGRSSVTVEGQIVDGLGQPVPQDAVVTLTASAGKFVGADFDRERPGFQVLARGGKFTAKLQSNLAPQKVRIRAATDLQELRQVELGKDNPVLPPIQKNNNGQSLSQSLVTPPPLTPINSPVTSELDAYTQVEFTTNLRPFLVSGSVSFRLGAGGTDFYGSFRDFLNPNQIDEDVRFDSAINAFATGRIGDWLLTAAFNNQRPLNQTCDGTTRLFRDTQFCDQVYPTFGDSSSTDFLTPSIDSVYARIERTSPFAGAGTDYFMWGDYSSPEFATPSQLYTATNRQLHGFKGNFNLGNLQITAMYGNNLQGFQRDAIAPNGTSGYYFLSRRLVLGGSEIVYLETEELARPGTVVSRKQLVRGPDYEIDYDRGSLLFRRPIQQVEFDPFGRTLVYRIVITYQYDGTNSGDTNLYAARLQYNFSREFQRESWLAASYLLQDENGRQFELYGADAYFPIGKDARLIGEFARSSNDSFFLGNVSGNAYRFELNGNLFEGVFARAYYNSVDENFANNATFSFSPGQTRYGAEVAAKVGRTTQLQFQVDHEANFGIASSTLNAFTNLFDPRPEPIPGSPLDNSLTTIRAGVLQKIGVADLSLEWVNRSRADSVAGRLTADSNQIVSRLTYPILKDLVFRAQSEQNIGSEDPLYPSRNTVGLDWRPYPGMTVRLAQQFISSTSQFQNNSITTLDTVFDQKLDEDTTFTGRYSILNGVGGLTSQTAFGLNRRIVIAPGLRATLAYERIAGDIFAYTGAGQQFAQPYAVGQSSASLGVTEGDAYSIGLDYTDNPNFKASGRFEYRTSDLGNNLVISVAAAGKLSPSLTALTRYQQANYANQLLTGIAGDSISFKLGLAYRNPFSDKFNALLSYEFRQNPFTTPDLLSFGTETGGSNHLVAVEAIYAPNYRWEFYGKFGLRSSRSYVAQDLLGTNAITLGQLRATYRLGYRWDVGGEVRWISQSLVGYDEVGFAVEAGYYLTPNIRVGLGYSFGEAKDRDLGDRSKGGPYLLFTLKLNELFEGFGLQRAFPENAAPKVAPPQQQESVPRSVAVETNSQAPPPTDSASPPATQPTSGGQGQ